MKEAIMIFPDFSKDKLWCELCDKQVLFKINPNPNGMMDLLCKNNHLITKFKPRADIVCNGINELVKKDRRR